MSKPDYLIQPNEFFGELLGEAFERKKLESKPLVTKYLSDLLIHFMQVDNLYTEVSESGKKTHKTLAEQYMTAFGATTAEERSSLLKKLGDTSLYICGMFGDSLQRKLVDVDYYVDMGGAAYMSLSKHIEDEPYRNLYQEIGAKFIAFMDILNFVAQKTFIQNNQNLLRLYETYIRTGSSLAKEQLIEKGILNLPGSDKKSYNQ